jgi:hypothetical protein
MEMAYYFVVLVRIVAAPLILIWPTTAIILSLFLDIIDADLAYKVITKKQYQLIDKILDSWVYVFELILAWAVLPDFRFLLMGLFVWRTIGLMIFLKLRNRKILLIFGNFFENVFFLLYFASVFKSLNFILLNPIYFNLGMAFAFMSKIFHEWFIHVADLSIREDIFRSKRKWKSDKITL